MNTALSGSIGPHFARLMDVQVKDGGDNTASDAVMAGSGQLEAHEHKVKALQEALNAGINSGEPRPFDSETFLSRMHAQHG